MRQRHTKWKSKEIEAGDDEAEGEVLRLLPGRHLSKRPERSARGQKAVCVCTRGTQRNRQAGVKLLPNLAPPRDLQLPRPDPWPARPLPPRLQDRDRVLPHPKSRNVPLCPHPKSRTLPLCQDPQFLWAVLLLMRFFFRLTESDCSLDILLPPTAILKPR